MSGVITYEIVGAVPASLSVAGVMVGWILSRFAVRDRKIEALQKDIAAHKLYASEHYVTKGGLTDMLRSMESSIDPMGADGEHGSNLIFMRTPWSSL